MEDQDLKQFDGVIKAIKDDGAKVEAPKSALLSVLNKIDVTEGLLPRNNYKSEEGSRSFSFVGYINQFNLIMNKQYIVAVVVLALVATGGVYWYSQNPAITPGTEGVPTRNKVEKATSESLAVEATGELANLDQDMADINDFNNPANNAALDALSKDLVAVDGL